MLSNYPTRYSDADGRTVLVLPGQSHSLSWAWVTGRKAGT